MLDPEQSKRLRTEGRSEDVGGDRSESSAADLLAAVRRQFALVAVFALVGLAAGVTFLALYRPNFLATTTILIDTRKYPESPQSDFAARTVYDSSAAIDTQVEILKSQSLARSVVENLSLWQDPEFISNGRGPRAWISNALGLGASPAAMTPEESKMRAVGHFVRGLTVKRVADTYTLDVEFESAYADQAAKVANGTAKAFIEWQRNFRHAALASAGEWLEGRIKDLRRQSTIGHQSVAEFESKNNIFAASGSPSDEKRLSDLSTELETARVQATDADAKLNQLVRIASDHQLSDLEIISAVENVAADPSVAALRLHGIELKIRYDQLSKLLPPNHQALIDMRAQIQSAHATMLGELARVEDVLKNNRDTLREKIKVVQSQIDAAVRESHAAASAQSALKQLELNAQTYQNLYDSYLHRYAEALQADRSPAAEASIISPADPPPMRNYKKTLFISALFPALGLLCGGGIAFVRERIRRPFWTGREIESKLRISCTDVVPELKPRELKLAAQSFLRGVGSSQGGVRRVGLRDGNPIGYFAVAKPVSRFAESLRSIRVELKLNGFEDARRAVGVTSALPNEGKSSIALALAASAASTGVRTILVDCDLRNPALTKSWLGEARRAGLVDFLCDGAKLDEIIQVDEDTNLHFISSGMSHTRNRAGELMMSDALAALIVELKSKFELVIVDLPPMSPVNDVASTRNFIDGYLLVVNWGKTKVSSVNFALRKMPQVHESIVSVVLNKVDIKKLEKFGADIREHYSNKHAGRYITT